MNTFVTKNGDVVQVERFMDGPRLTPGYWWYTTGHKHYTEQVAPVQQSKKLFGYEEKEFMAKQYK